MWQLSSPLRSRRRSSHAHKTAQKEDSDADTEGSGSEDGLDVPGRVRDEDYCPSPLKARGHSSGDDSNDEEQHGALAVDSNHGFKCTGLSFYH